MDSDLGKLFIGGISWETSEDKLKDYFSQYGDVVQTAVMRDKATGKPRGFGFVAFSDPSTIDRVLQDTHTIDGRTVEAKKAMSREEHYINARSGNNMMRITGSGGGGSFRTKKIFVGGLPPTLSDMEFRRYFESFGTITDVVVMYDPNTQRPRGFGFISFESEDSVDLVVQKQFHDVGGKAVEVKRALPKDANPSNTANHHPSFGGSGSNLNSYDNRVDGSRYMQPPASGAGYPPYGSAGYGGLDYGYGTAPNGVGYGSYRSPTVPGAGFFNGPTGASRNTWSNPTSTGYAPAGYGVSAGYGGPASGHTGQSPVAVASYGNQGYGYSGYGGGALVSNPTNSGEQGVGTGFTSGGYNDGSGNTGYFNAWRSDSGQGGGYGAGQVLGGEIGYGGGGYGYTGPQMRQGQQQ